MQPRTLQSAEALISPTPVALLEEAAQKEGLKLLAQRPIYKFQQDDTRKRR